MKNRQMWGKFKRGDGWGCPHPLGASCLYWKSFGALKMYVSLQQLTLSTMATLWTAESGHCREVETRVRVWTVCQNMVVVERWPLVKVRLLFRVTRERNLTSRVTHVCSV